MDVPFGVKKFTLVRIAGLMLLICRLMGVFKGYMSDEDKEALNDMIEDIKETRGKVKKCSTTEELEEVMSTTTWR
jgi:hypothetical protein